MDDEHGVEDHDRGLAHDLPRINRRTAMGLVGGAGVLGLLGWSGVNLLRDDDAPAGSGASGATGSTGSADGIPEETSGPYPGDGSNGPNVLTSSGIVRSDIRSSFGTSTGTAPGVPLTIELTVLTMNGTSTRPYEGAAVYLWHCDREGRYSLYSGGVTNENYLRGVQVADSAGNVSFTSIFPGCYAGRWPHVHFVVYPRLDAATTASGKLRTTQLALPKDACESVYATDGYSQSVANLARTSLDGDMVFRDGYSLQMARVAPSGPGYTATLNVPV
jgi:protocatechuate 3,4-dioxygenase beta subunit